MIKLGEITVKKEIHMKCPVCNDSTRIEIDMHSDGYADNLFECTSCGAMWIASMEGILLLDRKAA